MFGFGISSKAKRIIREEFFYDVSYMYQHIFKNLCQHGKMLGQNEYSVAIFYMMMMMNTLIDNQKDRDTKDMSRVKDFIDLHSSTILRILHQANSPESEIRNSLDEVNKNFNSLSINNDLNISSESDIKQAIQEKNVVNTAMTEDDSQYSGVNGDEINPFELSDTDMEKLMNWLNPFLSILGMANTAYPISFEPRQINFVRAIQLMGAIDYIGQSEGWSVEQLFIPFSEALKKDPFSYNAAEAFKIIGIISKYSYSEIISLQMMGARLFTTYHEIDKSKVDREAFKEIMWEAFKVDNEEISKLITPRIIDLSNQI